MARSPTTFQPGNQTGRGRPKGSPNKVTAEAHAFARQIVDDPEYRENLFAAARKRKLHPRIEEMLWSYAYGKPKDTIELQLQVLLQREIRLLDEGRARRAELPAHGTELLPSEDENPYSED
jgi:hypothetical protein